MAGCRSCRIRSPASDDNVWLVAPPIDDSQTTLGPDDLRFEPKADPAVVRDLLDRLFAMSPELEGMAPSLRWSCYAARKAQHPMMATNDSSLVAQPVPAKLDAFGLDGLLALWPSHLGYAMVLGDVVVERIEAELGGPGEFGGGLRPSEVSIGATAVSRPLGPRQLPVARLDRIRVALRVQDRRRPSTASALGVATGSVDRSCSWRCVGLPTLL